MRPQCLRTSPIARSISGSLERSAWMAIVPGPSFSRACLSVSGSRPEIATRAPSAAKACAVARPMPLLPPVTKTTLSWKRWFFMAVLFWVTVSVTDKGKRESGGSARARSAGGDAPQEVGHAGLAQALLERALGTREDAAEHFLDAAADRAGLVLGVLVQGEDARGLDRAQHGVERDALGFAG